MISTQQLVDINLNDIVDIDDLPDRELDENTVKSLVARNEPGAWPPIIVTPWDNGKFGRIAGKHRIEAAKRLKLSHIQAEVKEYGENIENMYSDMWEDNVKNGRQLSTKERKEYAVNLHKLFPELTLRELGRRSGLPHQTVKTAIKSSPERSQEEQEKADDKAFNKLIDTLIEKSRQFDEETPDLYIKDCAEFLFYRLKDNGKLEEEDINTFENMGNIFLMVAQLLKRNIG